MQGGNTTAGIAGCRAAGQYHAGSGWTDGFPKDHPFPTCAAVNEWHYPGHIRIGLGRSWVVLPYTSGFNGWLSDWASTLNTGTKKVLIQKTGTGNPWQAPERPTDIQLGSKKAIIG